MKFIILAVCVVAALAFTTPTKWDAKLDGQEQITDDEIYSMYREWLQVYEKDTSDLTATMERYSIFKTKTLEIIEHNSDKTNTWKKGINAWSDLTDDEFYARYPPMEGQECSATNESSFATVSDEELPAFKDWREAGVVSSVKDQSGCGSCWTFSTTGTFESHYAIAYGTNPDDNLFSEQQLLDCSHDFDNNGCMGGLPSHAFTYIYYYGLETEEQYEYHAADESCKYNEDITVGSDFGAFNITEGDEYSMKQVIANVGPVAIAYQVVGDFRDYKSGVYTSDNCKNGRMDVNHAVQAVGYGTDENGMDYWIVKNSWGSRWGEHGYARIAVEGKACGLLTKASFPTTN